MFRYLCQNPSPVVGKSSKCSSLDAGGRAEQGRQNPRAVGVSTRGGASVGWGSCWGGHSRVRSSGSALHWGLGEWAPGVIIEFDFIQEDAGWGVWEQGRAWGSTVVRVGSGRVLVAGHPLCFRLLGQDFEPFSVLFLEFRESPRLLWGGSELFMFSRRIPQPVWELSVSGWNAAGP